MRVQDDGARKRRGGMRGRRRKVRRKNNEIYGDLSRIMTHILHIFPPIMWIRNEEREMRNI